MGGGRRPPPPHHDTVSLEDVWQKHAECSHRNGITWSLEHNVPSTTLRTSFFRLRQSEGGHKTRPLHLFFTPNFRLRQSFPMPDFDVTHRVWSDDFSRYTPSQTTKAITTCDTTVKQRRTLSQTKTWGEKRVSSTLPQAKKVYAVVKDRPIMST